MDTNIQPIEVRKENFTGSWSFIFPGKPKEEARKYSTGNKGGKIKSGIISYNKTMLPFKFMSVFRTRNWETGNTNKIKIL